MPLFLLFDLSLEARAEISETFSLVLWEKRLFHKDILKLSDLWSVFLLLFPCESHQVELSSSEFLPLFLFWQSSLEEKKRIISNRIFGAYVPIMFTLRVWVVLELWDPQFELQPNSSLCSERHMATNSEGHMASCLEGHFLSVVFGRTHCIMFGRTLFRIWQIKNFEQTLSF